MAENSDKSDVISEEEEKAWEKWKDQVDSLNRSSQDSYDKTVLALSSGALGISFAFVSNYLGDDVVPDYPYLLLFTWTCWALSVTAVLASFLFSILATRKAIVEYNNGVRDPDILIGRYDWFTEIMNWAGGALFVLGLFLMLIFATINFERRYDMSEKPKPPPPSPSKKIDEGQKIPAPPPPKKK